MKQLEKSSRHASSENITGPKGHLGGPYEAQLQHESEDCEVG